MPALPVIGAIGTVAGVAGQVKGMSDAKKAANQAANTPAPTVNIADLQRQAQDIAVQNATRGAELERQFNPGAAQLRQGSLEALLSALSPEAYNAVTSLANQGPPNLAARPGLSGIAARPELSAMPTRGAASPENAALLARIAEQAGTPLATTGFDSGLTRAAIEQARADLALGGELPQDVRNLIARTAAARSGAITGGLGLGRDITARDLGLTSLDLRNRRLANAASIGAQEAALEQANAAMRTQAEQFGRNNLLQSQGALAANEAFREGQYATDAELAARRDALQAQNYATDAQIRAAQDALRQQGYAQDAALASQNYFNQAGLLENIASGNFARAFQAAQLGQNIAQPASGLDPGSVANLAVGNQNVVANQQQNAAALRAQSGRDLGAIGGQLAGAGLGYFANRNKPTTYGTYTAPTTNYIGNIIPGFA
jgi:hypothetical protein